MTIEFGMLQSIKAKGLAAKGPQTNQQKINADKAQTVFEQYEQYKKNRFYYTRFSGPCKG